MARISLAFKPACNKVKVRLYEKRESLVAIIIALSVSFFIFIKIAVVLPISSELVYYPKIGDKGQRYTLLCKFVAGVAGAGYRLVWE